MDREKYSAAIFRRGQKAELFADNDDGQGEDLEVDAKLHELLEVWKLPRSGKEIGAAIWRPQHQAAEVVLKKGRLFNHTGFLWGNKHFLHIEEAAYLVDRANLMLFVDTPRAGKRLLSLQETHEIMASLSLLFLGNGVTMDMFLVYCKLMRAGYIVQRHPSAWVVKHSESPLQIWQRPSVYNSSLPTQEPGGAAVVDGSSAGAEDGASRPEKRQRLENNKKPPPTASPSKAKKTQEAVNSRWWATSASWARQHDHDGAAVDVDTSLPKCEVQLSTVQQAQALFPNLQPLHHLASEEIVDVTTINQEGARMLHFDVFNANSQFSRKAAGDPLFIISVCAGDATPSLSAINAADAAAGGIPVRYSRIEMTDIGYFAVARTELRKILS